MSFQAGTRWVPTAAGGMTLQTADGSAIVTITSAGAITSSGLPLGGIYDADGVFQPTVRRIYRVVGPASYATGGFQVDCSAFFSRIVKVGFLRCFTTATGEWHQNRQGVSTNQTGTDLFTSAKFRGVIYRPPSHTHAYDKTDTPTGTNSAGSSAGTTHTHDLTYTSTQSGAASAREFVELQEGTVESSRTYEFEVEGVPL